MSKIWRRLCCVRRIRFYQRVREWVALFNGVADSTMIREREWHFIQSGKHLERAENTLRVLQSVYTTLNREGSVLTSSDIYNRMIILLKSVSGYEAFRKFYADEVICSKVTKFMMLNTGFPRSVMFAATSLGASLTAIQSQDYQFESLLNESKAITEELRETLTRCNNGLSQRDIFRRDRQYAAIVRPARVCHLKKNFFSGGVC
ncbi:hypothetical protein GCM10020331_043960 [Ectobacillus funiculus]